MSSDFDLLETSATNEEKKQIKKKNTIPSLVQFFSDLLASNENSLGSWQNTESME